MTVRSASDAHVRAAVRFYTRRVASRALETDPTVARSLSARPYLSADLVAEHAGAPWDWNALSRNLRAVPLDFVLARRDLPWNWALVAARSEAALAAVARAGLASVDDPECKIELAKAGLLDEARLRTVVRAMTHAERDEVARHEKYHGVCAEFPDLGWSAATVSIFSSLDAFVAAAESDVARPLAPDVRYLCAPSLGPRLARTLESVLTIQAAWRRWYARRARAADAIQRAARDAYWNPRRRLCRRRIAREAVAMGCVPSAAADDGGDEEESYARARKRPRRA